MIHPSALVECEDLGAGTRVWAFAHVLQSPSVPAGTATSAAIATSSPARSSRTA